jgi:hypothetical protein
MSSEVEDNHQVESAVRAEDGREGRGCHCHSRPDGMPDSLVRITGFGLRGVRSHTARGSVRGCRAQQRFRRAKRGVGSAVQDVRRLHGRVSG